MLAQLCYDWGGPEVLRLEEVGAPSPGPEQVVVEVAAADVNFADGLMIAGRYQVKPPLPFSPGLAVAGRVAALGPGLAGPAPGTRVFALLDWGGYAELALARAVDVFPLPPEIDFASAAALGVTYGTAHAALAWEARLAAGETLLVLGAAGGVGLAAVEVGKALGARVIAAAGSEEKLALAQAHGADALLDYRREDLRERVKALTEGRGADVVFDPVGGELFAAALRSAAWGGRLLVVGFAAGEIQQIPANLLLVKHLSAIGVHWGSYRRHTPARLAEAFRQLWQWSREGRLQPEITQRLPLARAGEALALLKDRKARGKIVLTLG